jgi:2-dehydropantoate 2-reductase
MTTNADSPTIHLLGAGSMGLMIAARLQAVAPLLLIRRPGNRPVQLELRMQHGEEISICRLPQCSSDALPNGVTHLILCTKSHDALPALESLGAGLADDAQLLLMQNGMGSQEAVARRFPRARISAATTTEGAYRTAPDSVVHAARGLTRIGSLNDGSFDWVDLFRKAGFEAEGVADIRWHLADKLRVNALINPLTAVHGCLNGELLERPELLAKMEQLGKEADAVLAATGFRFENSSLDQAMAVALGTAPNRSSMLQDVTAGRQTEVEDITGYLLAMARRHGIEAPTHARLYETLISLTQAAAG